MDQLLSLISDLSLLMLPILGVVVLIFLIIVIVKTRSVINQYTVTFRKLDNAIETVNEELDEVKISLQTLRNISLKVDLFQDCLVRLLQILK
jgi:hypothetical protein